MKNRVTELFGIQYPVIAGGMIWISGAKLAAAVSNAGGLGLIGSGSMTTDVLAEQIRKCKTLTDKPFGVNVPMLYSRVDEVIEVLHKEGVKIIFTSAGNPSTFTPKLKALGFTVVHVVSSLKFALKSEAAGVDAVVAEGFEAGGHNGREETTSLCLIPAVAEKLGIPLIAAGGIASGGAIASAFALGAEGVQIGSLFAVSNESSAHHGFKRAVIKAGEGDTMLTLKELAPVRLIKNKFYNDVQEAYASGAGKEELEKLLGKGRGRLAIHDGDLEEGEIEIGQISSMINSEMSVAEMFDKLKKEYRQAVNSLPNSL